MADNCPTCGANMDLVGKSHRCVPRPQLKASDLLLPGRYEVTGSKPSKGLRIKARKSGGPIGDGVALTSMVHPPGLIDALADAIRSGKLNLKRGRPRIGEKRDQPWKAAGMSKTTWYRRKAEEKAK